MAKGIVLTSQGKTSAFGIEKLERAKLYGLRRRLAVDADGRICVKANLTDDGKVLLRAGMTAQGYFDPEGRQVENSSLGAVDASGTSLPLLPSTLGVPQALEGPVDPRDLLDLALTAVYRLLPEEVDSALASALAGGRVFRVVFNYRPDYRNEVAYLVQNDAGAFALVGLPTHAEWLAPDAPPPSDLEGDDGDELDFEMF